MGRRGRDARRQARRGSDNRGNNRMAATAAARQLAEPGLPGVTVERLVDGGAAVMLADGHTTPGPLGTFSGRSVAQNQQAQMALLGASNAGKPYPDMPKVSNVKPLLESMGATGTAILAGIITSEEHNEDFYWKDGVKIYEQMSRSEGQAAAITYLLELPVRRATWSIEPFSDEPVDKEIASFVETCLLTSELKRVTAGGRTVTQKWDDVLRHVLMMLRYGFSAFEVCYRIEDDWVKWSHFLPLLPRTVWRWWTGEDNELEGIQQWTYKGYSYRFVDIPADKLLLFVHRQEGQNYEGVSLFRSAYQHWWYKQNFYKIQAIDIERNAVPFPVITLPESFTDTDVAYAQKILANLRVNENMGVTLPPGWGFSYGNAHGSSRGGPGSQIQPAIDHHDVMMARSVLAQFVNLGSTETGAFALDASQKATLLAALQAECEYIEDVFNTDAIPRLVDYNFAGVAGYPKLRCGKVVNQDFSAVAEALQKLVNLPSPIVHPDAELEDYVRNEMGLPKAPQSVIEGYNPTAQNGPSGPQDGNGQGGQSETDNGTAANTGDGRGGSGDSSDLGDGEPGGDASGGGVASLVEGPLTEARALGEAARLLREAIAEADRIDAVEKALVFAGGSDGEIDLYGDEGMIFSGPGGHPKGYEQNRIRGKFAPGDGGDHVHDSGAHTGQQSHESAAQQRAGHAQAEAMHREAVAKRGGGKRKAAKGEEGTSSKDKTKPAKTPAEREISRLHREATRKEQAAREQEDLARSTEADAHKSASRAAEALRVRGSAAERRNAAEEAFRNRVVGVRSMLTPPREVERLTRERDTAKNAHEEAVRAHMVADQLAHIEAKQAEFERAKADVLREDAHAAREAHARAAAAHGNVSPPKSPSAGDKTTGTRATTKTPTAPAAPKETKVGEETKALRTQAKELKRTGGKSDIPVADSWLRQQENPIDASDSLARANGNHEELFGRLANEPTGMLEPMAQRLGAKVPRGADRIELARAIATHLAPTEQRAALEKTLLQREVELRQGLKDQRAGAEKIARTDKSKAPQVKSTQAPAAPKETIHEKAARLRAEQSLPEEVKPGEYIRAVNQALATRPYDPYATPAERLVRFRGLYGDHQLGAVLTTSTPSRDTLREMAQHVGAKPSTDKATTISRIVAAATGGAYTADFASNQSTEG